LPTKCSKRTFRYLDAIQYRKIPRKILEASGETVKEQLWGDMVVEGYVDVFGDLQQT
jgi:hypothetical protein